ncbi:MAG: cytochrome c oxidase subunit II [Bacteroidetes bacterium]|nr:cytochrome c oxidase subunit II [Bacteroidota bacterium]
MHTLLVWIVIILAVITVVRAVRILEMVNELGGDGHEDEITEKDNNFNGKLLLWFLVLGLGGMIWFTIDARKYLLPISASKHGVLTDAYLYQNFALIGIVFIITQILLFGYGYKYRHKKTNKAYFYPDNHKLEFWWTLIPGIVLIGLIVYGLKLWNDITGPAPKNSMLVEVYGKQFDFTARYAGSDNKLGNSFFRWITDENQLGVDEKDPASKDDKIARELHIPVNTPMDIKIHSRDVIHSVYLPHLRAQMNAVPGMTTQMNFVATITTAEMRKITNNPKFDYVMLCNKVCGVAHYNMNMKVVIDSPEDFKKWYKEQSLVFQPTETAPTPEAMPADSVKGMAEVAHNSKKIVATR